MVDTRGGAVINGFDEVTVSSPYGHYFRVVADGYGDFIVMSFDHP